MQEPETVEVVFRRWKKRVNESQSIIALMPYSFADEVGYLCDSYEHVGQHGAADYMLLVSMQNPPTEPATPAQYAGLLAELERIGYRAKPIKKINQSRLEAARLQHRQEMAGR